MGLASLRLNSKAPASMPMSLRVLAHLLGYPDTELRKHLGELREALRDEAALTAERLGELDALIDRIARRHPLVAEADYVELFDRGHSTSLHLFEHVHGDSRDRGPAMIDLAQTYEQAGLYLREGELPDYLPTVLQFVSTQPPAEARAFLSEFSHIVQLIFSALLKRHSAYASVLAALLDLAGEPARAVTIAEEPDLEESWAEPAAFDGCSIAGQARPGQGDTREQPVHFVERGAATGNPRVDSSTTAATQTANDESTVDHSAPARARGAGPTRDATPTAPATGASK